MHPHLRATIETLTERLRSDPRCLALQLKGSGGSGTDDEYSDVDLELVVGDEHYEAVSGELRDVCERVCGRIVLWFPEGVRADSCNYAFLFEHGGEQFLYDLAVATRSAVVRAARKPGKILFDKEGVLEGLRASAKPVEYTPERLGYTIDQCWIYAYLSGKYARRADVWKLLYVQQTIFRAHLEVLRALHPGGGVGLVGAGRGGAAGGDAGSAAALFPGAPAERNPGVAGGRGASVWRGRAGGVCAVGAAVPGRAGAVRGAAPEGDGGDRGSSPRPGVTQPRPAGRRIY